MSAIRISSTLPRYPISRGYEITSFMRNSMSDSTTERRDTYAYFWVRGFDCPPEAISERLGILPSEVTLKGELLRGGRVRETSYWSVLSPLARGNEFLDSHIDALLEILEPVAVKIRAIQNEYEVGINCVGYFYSSNPGFHLSREVIGRLSALKLSVDFDLYSYCARCDL